MYTFGQLPDYAEQLNAVIGPTGGDWLFELCRRYRRAGMPFVEAMAKAKEETKYLRVANVAGNSNRPEWRQKRHAELSI